ncbi:MAG: PilZ domain-containing protein, partial [Acidobacteriota bacterium]
APARIRIANRPAISLVDLSTGGALLDLPFQLRPESRVTLELLTSDEHIAVPFQLLRCYVNDLNDGLRYHAAGVFHQSVRLPAQLAAILNSESPDSLVATLEAFLRTSQASHLGSGGARFNELLSWVLSILRQGEPANLVSAQMKIRLAQQFPSLAIRPASSSFLHDPVRSARFFGLDFTSSLLLTMSDRRLLRASAQLLTLLDKNTKQEAVVAGDDETVVDAVAPSLVIHTVAEWQAAG